TFSLLLDKSEQERQEKARRLAQLSDLLSQRQNKSLDLAKWVEALRKHKTMQVLDRATIEELIDHIEIGKPIVADGQRTQSVKIVYRFVGAISEQLQKSA
ncbi:MAG: DUF4368 domain-containing protein, partial [Oscillospiraceae bacterium]